MTRYQINAHMIGESTAWEDTPAQTLSMATDEARTLGRRFVNPLGYKGYGPKVMVRDADSGEVLHEERL